VEAKSNILASMSPAYESRKLAFSYATLAFPILKNSLVSLFSVAITEYPKLDDL
jgi:hypothetical protein